MDKFSNLLQQLKQVGLKDFSGDLEKYSSIMRYVYANIDTSKEVEVIKNIADIVSMSQNMEDNETYPGGVYLAPYSIEANREYIIFNKHPLGGASKRDVMGIGLPNYIEGFTKYFMENRAERMYGKTKAQYLHAASILEKAAKELNRNKNRQYYSKTEDEDEEYSQKMRFSPIYREAAKKSKDRLFKQLHDMDEFKTAVVREWIPLFLTPEEKVEEPITEEETKPKAEQVDQSKKEIDLGEEEIDFSTFSQNQGSEAEQDPFQKKLKESSLRQFFKFASDGKQGFVEEIKELDSNFEEIKNNIDSNFAQRLNMSVEEFRSFIEIDSWLRESNQLAKSIKIAQLLDNLIKERDDGVVDQIALRRQKAKEQQQKIQKSVLDKKRIQQILKQKNFYKTKKMKGGRGKVQDLLTPSNIKDSWVIMQKDLESAYFSLVKDLVSLYQSKEEIPQKEIINRNKTLKTNERILTDLSRSIQILGGIG